MKLHVVILAAGQGKRMCSTLPKVLHPVAGKPLLQHVVDTALVLQPEKLTVVYGADGEKIQAGIEGSSITWVRQEQPLGTAHAVQQALLEIDTATHILVLYGDVPGITDTTLASMQKSAIAGADIVVLTATVSLPFGLGRIIRNAEGGLQGIVEERDASDSERQIKEVNSGLMLCSLPILRQLLAQVRANNAQGEYYLTDIIALGAAQGFKLDSVMVRDPMEVQGINDRHQLSQVERYYQQAQALQVMQAGATLADPARFDVRGTLNVEQDVFIDINCVFEGVVSLASGVTIGPNCLIKNSIIEKNVTIHANTMLDGAFIASNCRIGPFARIRPESHVGSGSHVGNFVELKKTVMGERSKANHLAYLGDALIGLGVNIGAGVITCNYDGANKYTTTIEDDVFVGSNSQLVAPLKIAEGSTIGAGSTITEDTPANTLTLARAKQISIVGWSRPIKKL